MPPVCFFKWYFLRSEVNGMLNIGKNQFKLLLPLFWWLVMKVYQNLFWLAWAPGRCRENNQVVIEWLALAGFEQARGVADGGRGAHRRRNRGCSGCSCTPNITPGGADNALCTPNNLGRKPLASDLSAMFYANLLVIAFFQTWHLDIL